MSEQGTPRPGPDWLRSYADRASQAPAAGSRLELRIYDRSISVDEHRQLRHAAGRAATGTDAAAITWLDSPEGTAAIVPAGLAEYALRHGWGR